MDYKFLKASIEKENIVLPESNKIDKFLLKNNQEDTCKDRGHISRNKDLLDLDLVESFILPYQI